MFKIKIFCEDPVTDIHAKNIFNLVVRSTNALRLPHGSHLLILRGKYAQQAIREFAKVNVNWTRERQPTKYGVTIGRPISRLNRMQILACPNTLI